MSCSGQWVITNYVYTVSNITIVTQNEITQNVNRAYNYYSTNFTINVETNLYIDTLIGTNIATNVEMTVNVTTNLVTYETNFIDNIHREITYHTTYETNVNTYIDTWQNLYQTNYTTEVTLTNFEGYVQQCENIVSNGIDTISEMTNTVGDAMLYAYMVNELAVRLASTNEVLYYSTNSFVYVDSFGNQHDNVHALACNNMNGAILAKSSGMASAQSYRVRILDTNIEFYFDISHAAESEYGMDAAYLPRSIEPISYLNYYYIPLKLCWRGSYKVARSIITGGWDWSTNGVLSVYFAKMSYSGGTYEFVDVEEYTTGNYFWPERIAVNSYLAANRLTGTGPAHVRIDNPTGTYTDGIYVLCFPTFPSFSGWETLYKLYKITGLRLR